MPQISLCMIAKNEQANLEKCFNSVKGLVDEIVVVDTGSTDKTKEIAKKFGSKIVDFKWKDDFSAARNESLKHATKDWILVLDADEAIDKNGSKEMMELIKKEYDAYLLPQINYTSSRAIAGFTPSSSSKEISGHYISMICRLFRNKKGYEFRGIVHELVEHSIKEKKGNLAASKILIHHYGNADPEITKQKKEYYLELSKKKVKQNPNASSYYELGILFKENNKLSEAEVALKKSLTFNPKHDTALYELGIINEMKNELDKAIEHYTNSLKIKEDAEAFFSLGSSYLKKGDLKKAYRNLTKSLLLNPNKYKTYNNLGAVHERSGNYDEAIKVLEIGVKLNPKNAIGYFNLGVNYDKSHKKRKALECFEKALSLNHPKKEIIKQKIKELKDFAEKNPSYTYAYDYNVDVE